ncbi:MAG: hypothetical protein ACK56I_14825, partial [bacterium]
VFVNAHTPSACCGPHASLSHAVFVIQGETDEPFIASRDFKIAPASPIRTLRDVARYACRGCSCLIWTEP